MKDKRGVILSAAKGLLFSCTLNNTWGPALALFREALDIACLIVYTIGHDRDVDAPRG
jgi:hypothetical protein